MAMGYTDRTNQFSQLVETATDRARKDIALAEEARARNAAAAMLLPSQIAEKSLQGLMTGRKFAGDMAGQQQQQALQQQELADKQRAEALAEEQQTLMQQEYKPGMTLAQAKQIIPLQVQEKSVEGQAASRQAAIQSASEKLRLQGEALDLKRQLAERGGLGGQGKPVSETTVANVMAGPDAIRTLRDFHDFIGSPEVKSMMGPGSGRLAGVQSALGFNPLASEFESRSLNVMQTIGKMKEGGVLKEQDVARYQKMLPGMKHSPEAAQKILNYIAQDLKDKHEAYVAALRAQGYRTAGFEPVNIDTRSATDGKTGSGGLIPSAYAAPFAPKYQSSPEDAQAAKWAAENPQDPRAAEIMKRLGGK